MKLRLLALFLFLGHLSAWGQGSVITGVPTVTNGLGQPLPGATVAVCTADPGSPSVGGCASTLATLYTDITLGTPCTGTAKPLSNPGGAGSGCSNPGTVDGSGNAVAFGAIGQYWCEYYGGGITGVKVIPCIFPTTASGGSFTFVNVTATGTISGKTIEGIKYADQCAGADAGAKINACIALLTTGGVVDARGFGPGTQSYSTPITWSGKTIRLIADPTTTFSYTGAGSALLVGESSDKSEVDGFTVNCNGAAYGIRLQGSWYTRFKTVHPYGCATAGMRISNDGSTNRGAYITSVDDSILGDGDGSGYPPAAGKKNAINLIIESVNISGVTYVTTVHTWLSYATGDNLQILGTVGQAIGTTMVGGGSSYAGGNGVYLNGSGVNYYPHGIDIEGNTGWGIYSETNVLGINGEVDFSNNTSGDYNRGAQMYKVFTSGQELDWVGGATPNTPLKNILNTANNPTFSAGVEQRTPPIGWGLTSSPGTGALWEEAVKGTNDAYYWRVCSNNHTTGCFWFDPANNRVALGVAAGLPAQFWTPGASGTVGFPAAGGLLAAYDKGQAWTVTQTFNNGLNLNAGSSAGIYGGVYNGGTGFKHVRSTTTCTTGAAVGAICTTAAITWPGTAFADTSYTLTCTLSGALTNVPTVINTAKSAGSFTVTIAALTAAAASYAEVDCSGVHD